jgi:acyl-CoA reductase-like NAD-dependent aldehyde dehydrogenase
MGPLTSSMHRDRVPCLRESREGAGGEILLGGKPPERDELSRGFYVEPTVVRAKPGDRVSQEEVFGPFVTVTTFRDDEEVMAIANGTEYGLAEACGRPDLQRAHRMAAAMRSGMVWINCYKRVNPGSPFRRIRQIRLRTRNGFRGDARLHRGEIRLGQCRLQRFPLVPSLILPTKYAHGGHGE